MNDTTTQPEVASTALPEDIYAGQRVRHRRLLMGQTQTALANAIGISFQQVQKYETGANRIAVSTLAAIARAQGVGMSYYLEDIDPGPTETPISTRARRALSWLATDEAVKMAEMVSRMGPDCRRALMGTARALSDLPA